MRRSFWSLPAVIFFLLWSPYGLLFAQWKQVDIGQPGPVIALAKFGNIELAGTLAGIYRSTDLGESWTNVSAATTRCFAAQGPFIFAGTNHGILRSADGGRNWNPPGSSLAIEVRALAVKSSYLFAGGGGMYCSTDSGESWTRTESGMVDYESWITGLALDSTGIYASTYAGVMFSSDNGGDWTKLMGVGTGNGVVNCVTAHDSTIIVGSPDGTFRSTDNGKTWTMIYGTGTILSFSSDSSGIIEGTVKGVIVSNDNGAIWANINLGLPKGQVWTVFDGDGYLFCGTNDSGVFRSSDNGSTWQSATGGIVDGARAIAIAGDGSSVFVVLNKFPTNISSLYLSANNGRAWVRDTSLHVHPTSLALIDSSLFVLSDSGIFRSSNQGETWELVSGPNINSSNPSFIGTSNLNLMMACSDSGAVFLTTDEGASWKDVGTGLPSFTSLASNGPNVLAGSADGVYLSSDNGETWSGTNASPSNINAVAVSQNILVAGRYQWPFPASAAPSPPGGVFRSTDWGSSWSTFSSGLPSDSGYLQAGPQVEALAFYRSDLYAGLDQGIYACNVNIGNWTNVGYGLPITNVNCIYSNDSTIFIGVGQDGIWKRSVSEVAAIEQKISSASLQSFRLFQNYPNPFNPTTRIEYTIAKAGRVSLKVYDVLGREVETIVNENEQPGRYSVNFDGSRLASGVCFYRLEAGSNVITKKLLLLK